MKVAVLGAAGKMGKGITELLLQELSSYLIENQQDTKSFQVHAIDPHEESLFALRDYLSLQLTKYAERKINAIRGYFANRPDLVSNEEMIRAFVQITMGIYTFSTAIEDAKNCDFIFEAIIEDLDVKVSVLKTLERLTSPKTFFLSNTSSIPIHVLAEKAGIQHRLIGFHFYNPPVVQKLVECVIPSETAPELVAFSKTLCERLGKVAVFANDIAGFIGNGHFIREIAYACQQVERLSQHHSVEDAIFLVDSYTREILLRPMGIFQLIDFVGIDVCNRIALVMSKYIPGQTLCQPLIGRILSTNHLGGQQMDGGQKEGFFGYSKGNIVSQYDFASSIYREIDAKRRERLSKCLGFQPALNWKSLTKDRNVGEKLVAYEKELFSSATPGAIWAREYLTQSRKITLELVETGVAKSVEDVHRVLKNGFYQVYV